MICNNTVYTLIVTPTDIQSVTLRLTASLHDFYLSLTKQATPVIEVGAAKKITVIISEGKELEIREIEGEPF